MPGGVWLRWISSSNPPRSPLRILPRFSHPARPQSSASSTTHLVKQSDWTGEHSSEAVSDVADQRHGGGGVIDEPRNRPRNPPAEETPPPRRESEAAPMKHTRGRSGAPAPRLLKGVSISCQHPSPRAAELSCFGSYCIESRFSLLLCFGFCDKR